MSDTYSIGTLSQLSGVNIETIRYYEKVGLLPAANRTSNGYRQYDDASVEQLAFVRRGRELGFTIDEMCELLALANHPNQPCADADRMTRSHLEAIEAKIRDLQRMRRALRQVADCHGQKAEHCRLLKTLGAADTNS
ncbi:MULTISPECIES: helix-turn-helix domain-containing protein [unclassified Caballeronia]|uniref:MerR family transcriptional regulator n=1 Tax=unclassified Caballeronia TaxID=2646786 RepID=UPI0028570273|nr:MULTISPECIES: helix-turn-helix domain-containing protein [unclassified Caballeronia]MDR5777145.1 helix-turn-helix domain-containing protein [Caballeronia sp. LZ002]MDR5798699.1 helix-turn-helix domain-containing protein [Caballeronia sp. LZ001]MDR5852522.1 helix-turn-helix domain-containing protein [Caballeronia sp. LZ003]